MSSRKIFYFRDYSELLRPKKSLSKIVENVGPKKLSDLMKLDLLEDKTADEIKCIWLEYHKSKPDVISAVIPVEVFDSIVSRGKEFPTFIIPLPRSQGSCYINRLEMIFTTFFNSRIRIHLASICH